MAVDTKAKRMSVIGLALPVPTLLPVANNTISAADRLHLLWLYAGIAAQTPVTFVVSAIVAIRTLASNALAIRSTASGNIEIRSTASGEVDV